MISHSYATDMQTKAGDLASTICGASLPPQISAACAAVESFLHKHTPEQNRWFFSITFPTLICKLFGFDEPSPAQKSQSPSGWIDIAIKANDSELASTIFTLLSPSGVLLSSISAVDRLNLVKYVFPVERLPEWVRYMLQNERDVQVLADLCPLFKNRTKADSIKGSPCQIQLNVFDYYIFWFAYYPVCRGNNEGPATERVRRSRRFRLENWAYSIPVLSSSKRGTQQKNEGNLYMRLLYAYLRAYVPVYDGTAHQPYRSSLLQYSSLYNASVIERAEFLVNALIHFWLVDNDFSPLPINICKSFGVVFPFRTILGVTPPTSGLAEIVNIFVKYLNLSLAVVQGSNHAEYSDSSRWKAMGASAIDVSRSGNVGLDVHSVGSWNTMVERPLYRFILRTFLLCPMESSMKNASQIFTLWVNYLEPWMISMEEFTELDSNTGHAPKEVIQSLSRGYNSCWQSFVLQNYLFYSSLVMHFIGFAHKFLHTDPEVVVQMVSKVINILTSSSELAELIKNVDTVFHATPAASSKSVLKTLYAYVPSIREQLQFLINFSFYVQFGKRITFDFDFNPFAPLIILDWEDGLCESDADGSFLHENWNKDLRLFSNGENGGQQLLQLFVLRAESELQATCGDNLAKNLQCLDSLKSQLGILYGSPIVKSGFSSPPPSYQNSRDEMFKPRSFGSQTVPDVKYKGDWMKRPISDDEIGWLAKVLVWLSGWLNEHLGLNDVGSRDEGQAWSFVELSCDGESAYGPVIMMKMVLYSLISWFFMLGETAVNFMRKHGMRVNLRMLASKKVVMMVLVAATFSFLKRAFA